MSGQVMMQTFEDSAEAARLPNVWPALSEGADTPLRRRKSEVSSVFRDSAPASQCLLCSSGGLGVRRKEAGRSLFHDHRQ